MASQQAPSGDPPIFTRPCRLTLCLTRAPARPARHGFARVLPGPAPSLTVTYGQVRTWPGSVASVVATVLDRPSPRRPLPRSRGKSGIILDTLADLTSE